MADGFLSHYCLLNLKKLTLGKYKRGNIKKKKRENRRELEKILKNVKRVVLQGYY